MKSLAIYLVALFVGLFLLSVPAETIHNFSVVSLCRGTALWMMYEVGRHWGRR